MTTSNNKAILKILTWILRITGKILWSLLSMIAKEALRKAIRSTD